MAPAIDIKAQQAGDDLHSVAEGMKYPDYYPYVAEEYFPETEAFEYNDPALRADPNLPLFKDPRVSLEDFTPKLGTKITGLQLADLDSAGLDQLALFVARRGFVIFSSSPNSKQTFVDVGIERQLEIARHFGVLHKHGQLPRPPATKEMTVVYQDKSNAYRKQYFAGRNSRVGWHHDQSQERQPPGITFFACLETAASGGDTLFANCVEAFERLSPKIQGLCHDLTAIHSSISDAARAAQIGSFNRKGVVENAHPVVIEHPVTGKKSLFVDAARTTHIEGLNKEESNMLLDFLNWHIAFGQDFQARVKWQAGDVCLWDQRTVMHSALMDSEDADRRHFVRITPLAGVPKMARRD